MHHRWQRIHCDRCLEEQLSEDLSQVSPRRRHVCTHTASLADGETTVRSSRHGVAGRLEESNEAALASRP